MKPNALIFCLFVTVAIFLPPRQGVYAAEPLSLAGRWRFQLDPDDVGLAQRWYERVLPVALLPPVEAGVPTNALPTEVGVPNGALPAQAGGPGRIRLPGTTDEGGYGELTVGSDPGILTRVHKYYGPAWYQRDIEIPRRWAGQEVELFLERVLWLSTVWVDDRRADDQDSLNTPHTHRLGRLSPGRHRLTVRISNLMIHPISTWGHCFTEQTQTIWNGAVGRLELRPVAPVSLGSIRVFPDAGKRRVKVEVELDRGGETNTPAWLRLSVEKRASGRTVARSGPVVVTPTVGLRSVTRAVELELDEPPDRWDEFTPALYTVRVVLEAGVARTQREIGFGFRELSRIGQHIALNGQPVFFRGNLDCVHFPLTGYPPTDVASWKRLFRIYKAYGLNLIRFHSWTPPDAAFVAADEMGVYIHTEVLWAQRPLGNDRPGPVENPPGQYPASFQQPQGTLDAYVRAEIRRIMDTYGNHPSFVMFCIGNEMGSADIDVTGRWMAEEKAHDPRRLYAVTTARKISPACDYSVTHSIPGIGMCRDRIEPFTDWDYERQYQRAPVPIIAHEVGQWPTHPVWDEIGKYTGVLRARNLEGFRTLAKRNGVLSQDREFREASGALALRLYKDEIESHLRTPSCAGFELLSLQDFSGQGEALVGWLDSFYASKGTVTPERFRRWCNSTVPLARLPKYVFTNGESFTCRVEVAHYGPHRLSNTVAEWRLADLKGRALAQGKLPAADLPAGRVTPLGCFSLALDHCPAPCRLRLEVRLEGTAFANDWDLWVYAGQPPEPSLGQVQICDQLDSALQALGAGHAVLLLAQRLGSRRNTAFAGWMPVYWSTGLFPNQPRQTLGALVQSRHPALEHFPTDNHLDWQWQPICREARGFVLDDWPANYRPIVQPISDFHVNHKLGSLFEFKVKGGGKVLVCGYDLGDQAQASPAVRQLRRSLVAYVAGPRFHPSLEITREQLVKLLSAGAGSKLSRLGAKILNVDSKDGDHPAAHAIDGDIGTFWHTRWQPKEDPMPHQLVVNLGQEVAFKGVTYLPRQDQANGRVAAYEVFVSNNALEWGSPAARGFWTNTVQLQTVLFPQAVRARYLKVVARSEVAGHAFASIAELDLVTDEK